MKAEDFRLGNYYHFKQTGNKYSELNGWVVSEMQINVLESLQHETKLEWCKPIPLTEEWLLKLGFTEDEGVFIKLGEEYRFEILFYDIWRVRFVTPHEEASLSNYYNVHDLQNLYFTLTGEELTLNPTQ